MSSRTARSLRHEYELYLEQEIENYKESIPRGAILAIGDEAVASLRAKEQIELDEIVIGESLDLAIGHRVAVADDAPQIALGRDYLRHAQSLVPGIVVERVVVLGRHDERRRVQARGSCLA